MNAESLSPSLSAMCCMARYSSPVSSVTTRMLCSAMLTPSEEKTPQAAHAHLALCPTAGVQPGQIAQVPCANEAHDGGEEVPALQSSWAACAGENGKHSGHLFFGCGQLGPHVEPRLLAKHLPGQHTARLRLDSASPAVIKVTATCQALVKVLLTQPVSYSELSPELRGDFVFHARILA